MIIQVCIPESDSEALLHALEFPLEAWRDGRAVAGAGPASDTAFDTQRFATLLRAADVRDGCRRFSMLGEVATAMHTIARGFEAASDERRLQAPLLRRMADYVATGGGSCFAPLHRR